MEEILINIGNYGFPIIITGYLLLRMESKLENLSDSINELSKNILKSKLFFIFLLKKRVQNIKHIMRSLFISYNKII